MENLRIEKGKTYTYDELKEIYKHAMNLTFQNPTNECITERPEGGTQTALMLSSFIILTTMKENMFKEENEERKED